MSKYEWCIQFLAKEGGRLQPEWINSGLCFDTIEEAKKDAIQNAVDQIRKDFEYRDVILKAFVSDADGNESEITELKRDKNCVQTREHYK